MKSNNRSRTLYLTESGQVLQAALDANPTLGAFPVTSVPLMANGGEGGEIGGVEEAQGDFYGMISRANVMALIQVAVLEGIRVSPLTLGSDSTSFIDA